MERMEIEEALMQLGLPVGMKGFKYITEYLLLWDTPEWRDVKTTAIYEKVAKMNHTSAAGIERSIRYAFDVVRREEAHPELIRYYIGDYSKNNCALKQMYLRLYHQEKCRNDGRMKALSKKK